MYFMNTNGHFDGNNDDLDIYYIYMYSEMFACHPMTSNKFQCRRIKKGGVQDFKKEKKTYSGCAFYALLLE